MQMVETLRQELQLETLSVRPLRDIQYSFGSMPCTLSIHWTSEQFSKTEPGAQAAREIYLFREI